MSIEIPTEPKLRGLSSVQRRAPHPSMKALAEIQVIPLGVGTSVRKEVERAHRLIESTPGLTVELHAYGTNVEGELSDILAVIEKMHETLHAEGAPRLVTNLKIGTRTDKVPTLAGKRL